MYSSEMCMNILWSVRERTCLPLIYPLDKYVEIYVQILIQMELAWEKKRVYGSGLDRSVHPNFFFPQYKE